MVDAEQAAALACIPKLADVVIPALPPLNQAVSGVWLCHWACSQKQRRTGMHMHHTHPLVAHTSVLTGLLTAERT